MASALLASSNEPCWGEPKVYMRENPISNPNPRPCPNLFPSEHAGRRLDQFRAMDLEEVPPATSAAAVSDNSSSFNRRPTDLNQRGSRGAGVGGNYVTFSISTCSKMELRELKRRLVFELDQVQSLMSRIQSTEMHSATRSAGFGASSDLFSASAEGTRVSGDKATLPVVSPRSPKLPELEQLLAAMMKKCGDTLSKLMKHKKSVWFNSPVDVVGMGLHDYHQIIKSPMDLGTVKKKLNDGLYPSPLEFASDIRLTFNNALLYNPKGHEVHKLADQFLRHFEGLFRPLYQTYEKQRSTMKREEVPDPPPPPSPIPEIPSPVPVSPPVVHPPNQPQPLQQQPNVARTTPGKLPKPKAKDPNKRPMSFHEKQRLSEGLQSLPPERMAHVLHIARKGNVDAMQSGDEIELDIDALDTETLWALDRFLCNCKKLMSKMKRQEAIASGLLSAGHSMVAAPALIPDEGGGGDERSPVFDDETPEAVVAKKSKKGETAEEDVDIGDELPAITYPSVEIQKDTVNDSSSSSSGSDSSSASGISRSRSASYYVQRPPWLFTHPVANLFAGAESDSESSSDGDSGDNED
ncbi:hypothetical protein B296_00019923 [Ensete ventricosum]|uniref:Bromo domain-containing protein n=1 Tax=Ensete ventricosum TaxID=4639 RepID=A0A426YUD8_ENSVE|nr:hypothetical protein B296_00019923 [Ensete ventricosum]